MGIQPPALGAFAAKRRIRVDAKLRDVPIIAVTSFALGDHEAEARRWSRQVCAQAGQPSAATGHGG
jgi:CheY-like chemotaxis protein